MKTSLFARILILSGITAFGTAASASDELAGALIGAGTGAVIGHSIDRQEGAIVGGFIGAILGAAIADDDDYRRPASMRYRTGPVQIHPEYAPAYYRPAPVMVYPAPRIRYIAQPYYEDARSGSHRWQYEQHDRRDTRWDRDQDRRHDARGDRRGW